MLPGAGLTILCVDDDVTGLTVRRLLLESRGHKVITAESGAEALRLLQDTPVDLAILDYYMPEMNGGLLATELRRLLPHVPIIMLSAYFWLPREAMAVCDSFVTKSDPPATLFKKIDELFAKRARA